MILIVDLAVTLVAVFIADPIADLTVKPGVGTLALLTGWSAKQPDLPGARMAYDDLPGARGPLTLLTGPPLVGENRLALLTGWSAKQPDSLRSPEFFSVREGVAVSDFFEEGKNNFDRDALIIPCLDLTLLFDNLINGLVISFW